MAADYLTFGEILWDCLPSGRHAGGAPFNVAAHLAQLGRSAGLISAVGRDVLGDEILQVARDKGVQTGLVTRARDGLPTGTVAVTVDAQGNATYEIVQPVAWDEIEVTAAACAEVAQARALVYGSLAGRSPENRRQLERLLALPGPLRFFDVNLRPPFAEPAVVLELARRAEVLKLNEEELGRLVAWLRPGATAAPPRSAAALAEACGALARATGAARLCITRGAEGAALWEGGTLLEAPAPAVTVRDTVGAGDAFMAGLVAGLTARMELPDLLAGACRLGAWVASHHGATPLLPPELTALFPAPG